MLTFILYNYKNKYLSDGTDKNPVLDVFLKN